jgi:ABC-type sulfate transport system permease component
MILPEDGRILTHLSNDGLFLKWLRLAVLMQTIAVGTIQYVDIRSQARQLYVVLTSFVTSVVGIAACLYAFHRFYWMHRMIEFPGHDFLPDNASLLTPGLVVASFSIVLTYSLMAQDTDEAALLLLLSV